MCGVLPIPAKTFRLEDAVKLNLQKATLVTRGLVALTPRELSLLAVSLAEMQAEGLDPFNQRFLIQLAAWLGETHGVEQWVEHDTICSYWSPTKGNIICRLVLFQKCAMTNDPQSQTTAKASHTELLLL